MSVTQEQGQALENALNGIRNAVHDDNEKLAAVLTFAEDIAGPVETVASTETEAVTA